MHSTILGAIVTVCATISGESIHMILTTEDGTHQLSEQPALEWRDGIGERGTVITVDPATTYQPILGLGASLDHATAYNLSLLDPETRREVMRRIVDPVEGIGMNLMRLSIGTSDFTGDPWYTYADVPEGESDWDLETFSIEKDRDYLLPVIKLAQEMNPDIVFFASPWSPPAWMKTPQTLTGGSINPKFYDAHARYMVKFIRAYEAEGIKIHAVTPQNEPDFPEPNYPTTKWTGAQQRDYVRDHLGPLLEREGLDTEIWVWDHNWNKLSFPRTILNDAEAKRFVGGVGFHHYEGRPTAQTTLRDEFPDVPIYFTEGSTFGAHGAVTIAEILRNWARSYNAWVIMLDTNQKPNNGPHSATPTGIELVPETLEVRYNHDYFMYGQFMKYIQRGAVRIDSTEGTRGFSNIAVRNPDGTITMVVANAKRSPELVTINCLGRSATVRLPARATATFVWMP